MASQQLTNQSQNDRYKFTDDELKKMFKTQTLKPLESFKKEINQKIAQAQLQKENTMKDKITQTTKNEILNILNQEIMGYEQDLKEFQEDLFSQFKDKLMKEIENIKRKERQEAQKLQQVIQEQFTKLLEQQKLQDPLQEIKNLQTGKWMNGERPMNKIPCIIKPNQKLEIQLNPKSKIIIGEMVDSQGKPFQGKVNLNSYTCDSLKEPQKLKNLPPLLQRNSQDPEQPTHKLVSFSMQVNRFEDENGKLVFPKQPIQVVQNVTTDMKPEVLNQFKVWKWNDLEQKWIQTGSIKVSADGKQISYEIKPKTKEQILKVFESIGEEKISSLEQPYVFNVDMIQDLLPTLKQVNKYSDLQKNIESAKYNIRMQEYREKMGKKSDSQINRELEKLRSYQSFLDQMAKQIKTSQSSLFYAQICDYFIKKETMNPDPSSPWNRQDFTYIPKILRDISSEYLYKQILKMNKKATHCHSTTRIEIRSSEYSTYLDQNKLKQIETFRPQDDIKEIYVESPNKKLMEKFIIVNPSLTFFKNSSLEQINKTVKTHDIITTTNKETVLSLESKLREWLKKQVKKEQTTQKPQGSMPQKQNKGDKALLTEDRQQDPLHLVFQQELRTIAELILESKLERMNYITTNKFLIRLELSILFSLDRKDIIKFEQNLHLRKHNKQNLKKQVETILEDNQKKQNQLGIYRPYLNWPKDKFIDEFNLYFKIMSEENTKTINRIIERQIKSKFIVPQNLLMQKIQNPQLLSLIKQTENVIDQGYRKGVFELETYKRLKEQKVKKLNTRFLSKLQWASNQTIIQNIISEMFPNCDGSSSSYSQLLSRIETYCKTRIIMNGESDIEKFRKVFFNRYFQAKSKKAQSLPGGIEASKVIAQIDRAYGPGAGRLAIGGDIGNIDSRVQLTQAQRQFYFSKAEIAYKNKIKQLPKNIAQSKKKVHQLNAEIDKKQSQLDSLRNTSNQKTPASPKQTDLQTVSDAAKAFISEGSSSIGQAMIPPRPADDRKPLKENKNLNDQLEKRLKAEPTIISNAQKNKSVGNKQNNPTNNPGQRIVKKALETVNVNKEDLDELKSDQNNASLKEKVLSDVEKQIPEAIKKAQEQQIAKLQEESERKKKQIMKNSQRRTKKVQQENQKGRQEIPLSLKSAISPDSIKSIIASKQTSKEKEN